jgi:hypothetical protein
MNCVFVCPFLVGYMEKVHEPVESLLEKVYGTWKQEAEEWCGSGGWWCITVRSTWALYPHTRIQYVVRLTERKRNESQGTMKHN